VTISLSGGLLTSGLLTWIMVGIEHEQASREYTVNNFSLSKYQDIQIWPHNKTALTYKTTVVVRMTKVELESKLKFVIVRPVTEMTDQVIVIHDIVID